MTQPYLIRAMGPNFKTILLATAAIVGVGASPAVAFAQDASATQVGEVIDPDDGPVWRWERNKNGTSS